MGILDFLKRRDANPSQGTGKTTTLPQNDNKGKGYLLLFSANWCGPSKAFVKELKSVGFTTYTYVDVDENESLAMKFKITNIPTTVLLDAAGTEIKRWVGYDDEDPGQRKLIGFVQKSGYTLVDYFTKKPFAQNAVGDDDGDIPRPLNIPFTAADQAFLMREENRDKVLMIASDGGSKDETKIKLEVLLKKRPKTEAMLEVEGQLRSFFRTMFEGAGERAITESGGNSLLRKLAAATNLLQVSQLIDADDYDGAEHVKDMIRIANSFGVSFHMIKDAEYKRALAKYRDGVTV